MSQRGNTSLGIGSASKCAEMQEIWIPAKMQEIFPKKAHDT